MVAASLPIALPARLSTIRPTMRFEIQAPGLQILSDSMALSSDGRQIAYVASPTELRASGPANRHHDHECCRY
jgi:hypothetical protein